MAGNREIRGVFRVCLAAVLPCVFSFSVPAVGVERHVPAQYATIQAAIDSCDDGDIVTVADGVYSGPGNISLRIGPGAAGLPRGILLRSANGPESCVIDCTRPPGWTWSRGIAFNGGEDGTTIFRGFTIRNAWLNVGSGAAIMVSRSAPVIENCILENNTTGNSGAAIFCWNASPTIRDCTIRNNVATKVGGAIFCEESSAPTIIHCTITGNRAGGGATFGYGGAIHLEENSSAKIIGCEIANNRARIGGAIQCQRWSDGAAVLDCLIRDNVADEGGGGIHCHDAGPTIEGCTITGNTALWGGGLYLEEGNATVERCVIADNTARQMGGGILCYPRACPLIRDCTIRGNVSGMSRDGHYGGGGLWCETDSNVTLIHCAIAGNRTTGIADWTIWGGGLFVINSSAALVNCIVSGNVAGEADRGYSVGGGIGFQADGASRFLTLTNCTIVGNEAQGTAVARGGGLFAYGGVAKITNCVFWLNGDMYGTIQRSQIDGTNNPVLTVTYSCIQGWTPPSGGVGNIGADPLLVDADGADNTFGTADDNLRLSAGSPCVDAGNNAADTDARLDGVQPLPAADLDARSRRADDPTHGDTGNGSPPIVDMGAYEYGASAIPSRLFVSRNATGANNGVSWADAFVELRDALALAALARGGVTEIWVAAGEYRPAGPGGDRAVAFALRNGLGVYGGFAGNEVTPDARDPIAHVTILSGDLNGDDGGGPGFTSDNSYHVVKVTGTDSTAILDGFTIRGGSATGPANRDDAGGGIMAGAAGPALRHCVATQNEATFAGGMRLDSGRPVIDGLTLDGNAASTGSAGILSWCDVDLQGDLVLTGGTLELQSGCFDGPGRIEFAKGAIIRVGGLPGQSPTVMRASVQGPGDIEIDAERVLVIGGDAVVDLERQPDDDCENAAGGRIIVSGALITRDRATIQNATVCVRDASVEGSNTIRNNNIRLVESSPGYGGQFFVQGTTTIADNRIVSYGDRYLDMDPDPQAALRPVILRNVIDVVINPNGTSEQGTLLELRALDHDCGTPTNPDCRSGAFHAPGSAGFTADPSANWVLEKLEILPNARLNLTNRPGFQFQQDTTHPETVYVKNLVLRENAVLNTALQTLYYDTLVLEPGSRIVDVPLLGFSLGVIGMDDPTEYEVRVRTRLLDDPTADPNDPATPMGSIRRHLVGSNGVMEMRTRAEDRIYSAASVAAKGSFARAGDEQIVIAFDYLFRDNPDAELVVRLSDRPDAGKQSFEVARLRMPAPGRPGSIDSSEFAVFYAQFPRVQPGVYDLNFTRGTYVELELVASRDGENNPVSATAWIDNLDPQVICRFECASFDGVPGVTEADFLLLLAEYGRTLGPDDADSCLDCRVNRDHYVDVRDLFGWDTLFAGALNSCGTGGIYGSPPTGAWSPQAAAESLPSNAFLVSGKPNGNGQQTDRLYAVTAAGVSSGASVPPAGGPDSRGNGRLIADNTGMIYQIHGMQGLIRLSDGQVILGPPTDPLPTYEGRPVYVGVRSLGNGEFEGVPIADAVVRVTGGQTCVYVVPVTVAVPSETPPHSYRAAAKLRITGTGTYTVERLYGDDPYHDSRVNASVPEASSYYAYSPGEIELDRDGQYVFVTSAFGLNNNDWLLIYNEQTAAKQEVLLTDLSADLKAPTAMLASATQDKLYLSSSATGPTGGAYLYRLAFSESGPDVSLDGKVQIADTMQLTAVLEKPGDSNLYVTGFSMPPFDEDQMFENTDPIFTTPCWATVPADVDWSASPTQAIPSQAITGSDLTLPLSAVYVSAVVGSVPEDFDGDGDVDLLDFTAFQTCFNGPNRPIRATCANDADFDNDGDVDLADFTTFQRCFNGPNRPARCL